MKKRGVEGTPRWFGVRSAVILGALVFILLAIGGFFYNNYNGITGFATANTSIEPFSWAGPSEISLLYPTYVDLTYYYSKENLTFIVPEEEGLIAKVENNILFILPPKEKRTLTLIVSDGISIERVFLNISSNIVQTPLAMPRDRVSITVRNKNGDVHGLFSLNNQGGGKFKVNITVPRTSLNPSWLLLNNVTAMSESLDVFVDTTVDQEVTTDVVLIENIDVSSADIGLNVYGNVSAVVQCEIFDKELFNCADEWIATEIPFVIEEDVMKFTVDFFSAYAGGIVQEIQPNVSAQDNVSVQEPVAETVPTENQAVMGSQTMFYTAEFRTGESFDLADDANVTFNGSAAGDLAGIGLGSGDFNNDGADDVIIGAEGADPGGKNIAGQVYIFFGPLAQGQSFKASEANVTFNGTLASEDLMTGDGGDFNNDGIDDILLGSQGADLGGGANDEFGQAYIFFGPFTDGQGFLTSAANVSFNGSLGDQLGRDVGVGDLNNDSLDDVLIAGFNADPSGTVTGGQAYVFFSPFTNGQSFLTSAANVTFNGSFDDDRVAGVGSADLNNDSADDMIVGSTSASPGGVNNGGQAYVLFGPFSDGESFNLSRDANVTFNGSTANDNLGQTVDGGDFNGDGADDVLIGAVKADLGGGANDDFGQANVIFGPFSDGQSFIMPTESNVTFNGSTAGDQAGFAVGSGDFNNDTRDDIIIGAARADPGGLGDSGQAYIFFQLAVVNTQPTLAEVILNSTLATNRTDENLTAHPLNVTDVDNVTVNFNWLVDGSSLTVLNMPMTGPVDNGTDNITFDYSLQNHHAALGGGTIADHPFFNATGGPDGFGAYQFDGVNDHLIIPDSADWTFGTDDFTIEMWVNFRRITGLEGNANLIAHRNTPDAADNNLWQLGYSSANGIFFIV